MSVALMATSMSICTRYSILNNKRLPLRRTCCAHSFACPCHETRYQGYITAKLDDVDFMLQSQHYYLDLTQYKCVASDTYL